MQGSEKNGQLLTSTCPQIGVKSFRFAFMQMKRESCSDDTYLWSLDFINKTFFAYVIASVRPVALGWLILFL